MDARPGPPVCAWETPGSDGRAARIAVGWEARNARAYVGHFNERPPSSFLLGGRPDSPGRQPFARAPLPGE
jgi:hypothetical protein